MMSLRLRRTLLGVVLAVFAVCAAGVLAPAARADGDPGSDVLVYQNLFVAADANISIPQQVALGNLLTSADPPGFPIRVAVISQPADLGAITALWPQEPGRLRGLPRHRAVPRLRAAAAHRDAQRIRVQLAGALRQRGLPGAGPAPRRPGRDRSGHCRPDRGARARPGLGHPAHGPGQRQRGRKRERAAPHKEPRHRELSQADSPR